MPAYTLSLVRLAFKAVAWRPVPTVTVKGFYSVSMVMLLKPGTVRGAITFICTEGCGLQHE